MASVNTDEKSFNNLGAVHTSYGADFSAYDRLPLSVRRALSEAPYNISSEQVLEAFLDATSDSMFGISVGEFVQDFKFNMRMSVKQNSYTQTERNGEYEFRKSAAKTVRPRSALERVHARRHNIDYVFRD